MSRTVDLLYQAPDFYHEEHCEITYVDGKDYEELTEAVNEAFYQNVQEHHSMAYRE
jgi:hypothetical protein